MFLLKSHSVFSYHRLSRAFFLILWERHESLANFGLIKNGGVNRPALSIEDLNARKQILKWLEKTNIDSFSDDIANIFFRLEGIDKKSPPVLIGSHIDSQPSGGKYDGVFGVLAGIELIQTLSEKNIVPEVSIEVVSWMNEEGSRFAPGMMGSAVFTGARSLEKIKKIRDDKGIELETEIKKMNNSLHNLKKLFDIFLEPIIPGANLDPSSFIQETTSIETSGTIFFSLSV